MRPGHGIEQVLVDDVMSRALPALAAAKALGRKTAHARVGVELARVLEQAGTIELAQRLEEAELPEQTVSLLEVSMWVTQLQLLPLPEGAGVDALAERARVLNNLGVWQGKLGKRGAALASTREAMELRRKLAQERPDEFLPDLAMSLSNLGNRQGRLGQRQAALVSSHEAVEIYRNLSQKKPDAFLQYLALSLNNLGAWQSELGQQEEALTSFREAVEIRRELARKRPDAFLPDLAMSLTNLGKCESDLGQGEAALASAPEAVELYRKLAQERPDAFLPDLAMSLGTLGYCQSEMGQREAALASTCESVKLYRKLAQERPDAFLPDLARSLNDLGNCQSELGQREAGLASAQEALDVIWPFFLSIPPAFERLTRLTLDSLQGRLKDLGGPPTPELLDRLGRLPAEARRLSRPHAHHRPGTKRGGLATKTRGPPPLLHLIYRLSGRAGLRRAVASSILEVMRRTTLPQIACGLSALVLASACEPPTPPDISQGIEGGVYSLDVKFDTATYGSVGGVLRLDSRLREDGQLNGRPPHPARTHALPGDGGVELPTHERHHLPRDAAREPARRCQDTHRSGPILRHVPQQHHQLPERRLHGGAHRTSGGRGGGQRPRAGG